MNPEQPTGTEQAWGAPAAPQEPRRPRWSGRKTVAALAIAVTIAAGGGAVIYAATNDDSGTTQGGPGGRGPGSVGDGMGPRFMGGPLADALHGEFVVADGSTRLLQTGEVTSVSATSISLTSDDGYTASYVIDSSTEKGGDIQTGDEVTVIAKKADTTAISVVDLSSMQGGPGRDGQQPRRGANP